MQKMKADDIALGTFKPGDLVRWIGAWQFPLVDTPPRDNTVLAITDDGMVWLEGRHGGERAQQWYKCSGWKRAEEPSERPFYTCDGERVSSYRDGRDDLEGLEKGGMTTIWRWEHWIDPDPKVWMESHGWRRIAVPGKRWRSGAQAYTWERHQPTAQCEMFG